MSTTTELVTLPVAERLALIDELLASIPESEFLTEAEQLLGARGRWQELKSDPMIGLTYDQLKTRLG